MSSILFEIFDSSVHLIFDESTCVWKVSMTLWHNDIQIGMNIIHCTFRNIILQWEKQNVRPSQKKTIYVYIDCFDKHTLKGIFQMKKIKRKKR